MRKLSEQAWGLRESCGRESCGRDRPCRRESPRMQAGPLRLGGGIVPGLCFVKETGTGLGAGREESLKNASTYKLFPKTLLFEAPRYRISSGSECSSPTMVGPTSCKVSHSGC